MIKHADSYTSQKLSQLCIQCGVRVAESDFGVCVNCTSGHSPTMGSWVAGVFVPPPKPIQIKIKALKLKVNLLSSQIRHLVPFGNLMTGYINKASPFRTGRLFKTVHSRLKWQKPKYSMLDTWNPPTVYCISINGYPTYIGSSTQSLTNRLSAHISAAKAGSPMKLAGIIRELISKDLLLALTIEPIKVVHNEAELRVEELQVIRTLSDSGVHLFQFVGTLAPKCRQPKIVSGKVKEYKRSK